MKKRGCKTYTMDYLCTAQLTEDDLRCLLSSKNCLMYSLISEMLIAAGYKVDYQTMVKMLREDQDWMYKHFWDTQTRNAYMKKLMQALKNIYTLSDYTAQVRAEWFITMYGLTDAKMRGKRPCRLCEYKNNT